MKLSIQPKSGSDLFTRIRIREHKSNTDPEHGLDISVSSTPHCRSFLPEYFTTLGFRPTLIIRYDQKLENHFENSSKYSLDKHNIFLEIVMVARVTFTV